jgi:hypothetical protein
MRYVVFAVVGAVLLALAVMAGADYLVEPPEKAADPLADCPVVAVEVSPHSFIPPRQVRSCRDEVEPQR